MRLLEMLFWSLAAAVGYTYAGYPAILAILGRRRPEPSYPPLERLPSVTLIIAAYNEEAVIADKLRNSLGLDYPADLLEIIIAADGSDDGTAEQVRAFESDRVRLLAHPERRGKAAALNRAAQIATGEVLVFSDANNAYSPTAIRELVAPFTDRSVGGVIGAKRIVSGAEEHGEYEGLYWRYESFIQRMETRLGSCTAAVGEIMAVRRSAFEALPDGIICDDFYQIMRLLRKRYRVVYEPLARSTERGSQTSGEEMERRARIVAGRFQAMSMSHHLLPLHSPRLLWQIGSHKFLRPLVPIAMIGMAASNLLLAISGRPRWIGMLCLQAVFYATGWLGPRLRLGGMPGRMVQLSSFLISSNLAALLGLRRILFLRGRAHLWSRVRRGDWTDST